MSTVTCRRLRLLKGDHGIQNCLKDCEQFTEDITETES